MTLPGIVRLVLRIAPPGPLRDAMLGDLEQEFSARYRRDGAAAAAGWARRHALASIVPCARLRIERLMGNWTGGAGPQWGNAPRQAVRTIRARPMHATLLVLTLALGIGLNTSILATASQLLLAPLPYPDADRLVVPWPSRAIPGELIADLADSPSFNGLGLLWDQSSAVYRDTSRSDSPAIGYDVALVSRSYLDLLGLEPVLGRTFEDRDVPPPEMRSGVYKVVLTHHAWTTLFGSSPAVVGELVQDGANTTEIIGVMPPEATPFARGLHGWSVVGFEEQLTSIPRAHFQAVARLAEDAAWDETRAELETRLARFMGADGSTGRRLPPQWTVPPTFGPVSTPVEEQTLVTLQTYLGGNARGGLGLLAAASLATLAIALVNASALTLHRTLGRQREMDLRLALGAGRRSLALLLFAEQGLLAGLGGALAMMLAWFGTDVLATILPGELPHTLVTGVGGHAFAWTIAAVAICTALTTAVAAVPVIRGFTSPSTANRPAAGGARVTAARKSLNGLLVFQIALITVLVIGAGVLLHTVDRLRSVDAGFSWEQTTVIQLQATSLGQRNPESSRAELLESYFDRVVRELEAVGEVTAAGQGSPPLASPVNSLWPITDGSRLPMPNASEIEAGWRTVGSGDYFASLGVARIAGRSLRPSDAPADVTSVPETAVVNDVFAQRLWPEADPIGQSFHLSLGGERSAMIRVVGLVQSYRALSLDEPPIPLFFTRMPPGRSASTPVLVRTEAPPESMLPRLEEIARSVDPAVPVRSVKPLSDIVKNSIRNRESALTLLGSLAATGLALGFLGAYGIIALNTASRTRELGIRVALGGRATQLVRLVLRQGLVLAGAGAALGMLVAIPLMSSLQGLLFEVQAVDPVAFALAPTLILTITFVAAVPSALRTLRVDPTETLKCD